MRRTSQQWLQGKGYVVFLVLALSVMALVKFHQRAQGQGGDPPKTVKAAGRFGDPKPKKPKYRTKLKATPGEVIDAGNNLTLETEFKAVSDATRYTNGPTYRVTAEQRFAKPTKTAGNFILQPDFVGQTIEGKRRWVADSPSSLYNAANTRLNPVANGTFTAQALGVPGPGVEVTAELRPHQNFFGIDKPAKAALALTIRATLTITNVSITPSPVPFGSGATISYTLSRGATVSIVIISPTGNTRHLVTNVQRGAGVNSEFWDGKDDGGQFMARGVNYILRIQATLGVESPKQDKFFNIQ